MRRIVVKIHGGLGNQLFQYALYRRHKMLGHNVYADITKFGTSLEPRQYDLVNLGLTVREADETLINELIYGKNFISKLYHEHIKISKKRFIEQNYYAYDENALTNASMLLEGYWQNEKYFSGLRDVLLSEISFKKSSDSCFKEIEGKILDDVNAVSLHIRRGDFLKLPDKYCGICTDEYYLRAIDHIKKHVPDANFYIFSDDVSEVKEILGDIDYTVVECCRGDKSYLDMYLMSICKHNIIANSSFSWWGAWLNNNDNKIVVCPGKWVNDDSTGSMACDGWYVL